MMTQTCKTCGEDKPLAAFTMRKRPPLVPYQSCKMCEPVAYIKKPKQSYITEMNAMREKAKELRKFTPEQDAQILARYNSKVKVKELATEYGTSTATVYKALKRARRA